MPFDPKALPSDVQAAYNRGPIFWTFALDRAIKAAIFDIPKLTDMIFCMHHPDRVGNPLKPFETKLINEWKAFRTTITPWVQREERAFRARPIGCWPCGIEGTDVPSF